jgi:hypothetical protein
MRMHCLSMSPTDGFLLLLWRSSLVIVCLLPADGLLPEMGRSSIGIG